MKFDLQKSVEILSRTPSVIDQLLNGLSDEWLFYNEGKDTWSPYDIIGHLIHGEKTDWIPRARIILSDREDKTFVPFDRFAQQRNNQKQHIANLLEEFRMLRDQNLEELQSMQADQNTLLIEGIHPELGVANLKELLSTWVVHDLGHLSQISRILAKQYSSEVGPWSAYLGILK